jgi:SAM-dependent methyltransferase
MNLKFWVKTYLYRFIPFHFGHLHKYKEPNFDFSRDKHPVRKKHHGSGGWKNQTQEDFLYRDYEDYEEYKTHQIQKFNEILRYGYFSNRIIYAYRKKFYKTFRYLSKYLPKSAYILCAGARQGTEVEVLQDIGFMNAFGIDLNPGPNNKYVKFGDFMHLENPNSSLDMIYCNSLDHAYNLELFFTEHARVIKPNGFVLYEIPLRGGGPFESVNWKSSTSIIILMLKFFKRIIKVETESKLKRILLQGKKNTI